MGSGVVEETRNGWSGTPSGEVDTGAGEGVSTGRVDVDFSRGADFIATSAGVAVALGLGVAFATGSGVAVGVSFGTVVGRGVGVGSTRTISAVCGVDAAPGVGAGCEPPSTNGAPDFSSGNPRMF